MSVEIPESLKIAMQTGKVIIFLAAGATYGSKNSAGSKAPMAADLAKEIAKQFGLPKGRALANTAELAELEAGKGKFRKFIRERLEGLEPNEPLKLIPSFRWKAAVTVNYDLLLEKAYTADFYALQTLVPFVKDTDPIEAAISETPNPLPFYKLHGCINWLGDNDLPLVLTPGSYQRYKEGRSRLFDRFRELAWEHPIVFVGFNMEEPHILEIINRLEIIQDRPLSYLVRPGLDPADVRLLTNKRVVGINATFEDFMKTLSTEIPPIFRTLEVGSAAVHEALRKHLRVTSDPSPSLLNALNASLIHVHAGMRQSEVKPRLFYRGNDYGYDAILSDLDFERRVTSDIVQNALDSHSNGRVEFHLILGPAGRGKTIALRRAALNLSTYYDHLVFHAYDKKALKIEFIREMYSLTGKPITIIVDNAERKALNLKLLMGKAKSENIPFTVLGASRQAQWNGVTSNDRPEVTRAYPLKSISKKGFLRLLDKLEENNELGQLKGLPVEKRPSAFPDHTRELIAVLHEITEGKPFEVTLKDEYECIEDIIARSIYLDICTLFQFSAPVRAGMIKRLHGIPFTQFKERFFEPLEGVVLTKDNKYTGYHEYIARHPRIAAIVFDQVLDTDQKRLAQIKRVAELLDPGYTSDSAAINRLARAECAEQLFTTMESKRNFFATLTECFGEQWYIEQHRARLEYRDRKHGSLEQAEKHAVKAVELSDNRAAALHTLAEVARHKSDRENSSEKAELLRKIAKQRLDNVGQTESAMVAHSRVQIALSELRSAIKVKDNEKINSCVERVTNLIDRAEKTGDNQDRVNQLRARFREALGDRKNAAKLLKRAIAFNPKAERIRFEAVSAYIRLKDFQTAKELLEKGLELKGSTALQYMMGRVLIESEPGTTEIEYHLSKSFNIGDRNVDARLQRAAYLYSQREFEGASDAFKELKEKFGSSDAVIRLPGILGAKKFLGIVKVLYRSFALLEVSGSRDEIYLNEDILSETDWSNLSIGTNIEMTLAFTSRGPRAVSAVIKSQFRSS